MGLSLFPFLLLLVHLFFAGSLVSTLQRTDCHTHESLALLQFKKNLNINSFASRDPHAYPKTASWKLHTEAENSSADCCSWDGVECDGKTGHVVSLDLSSSLLYGSITSNSSLFKLVFLQRLDLADNNFNLSEIPSRVAHLSRLTYLNLSNSLFSGQIPSAILRLSGLVSLDLSQNVEIYSGRQLLELKNPSLRSLVQNLTKLEQLFLGDVNITSAVPETIGNVSSLTTLSLQKCGLFGEFPPRIFQLPKLQYLDVHSNQNLTGFLPEFRPNTPLKSLSLRGTVFSGELPASIGNLNSLRDLDVRGCNFSGSIPSSFRNLTFLTGLYLSRNSFTGHIPSSLSNLTQLSYLSLAGNYFDAVTLSWIDKLTKLTVLDFDNMNISSEIPYSIANLTQLSTLHLSSNQLTGSFPYWLMNLTQLSQLHLSGNNLQGQIPSSISGFKNLEQLDISWNNFSGVVELETILELKNLTLLQLSGNNLSILLPKPGSNVSIPKFQVVGLRSCKLTEFPNILENQNELFWLELSNNNIHGLIPTWIWNGSKESLQYLDLANNFLTGFEESPVLLPWSALRVLRLSSNVLRGPIPIPSPTTEIFLASQNELSGEIPRRLCDLNSLGTLDLSYNNLSGLLPRCLGNSANSLSFLKLRSNKFHGTIPLMFTKASNLRMMDLSLNKFQGHLPRSLENCTMLEHLDISSNKINDSFPFWLGNLPYLKVVILRSNTFRGAIASSFQNNQSFRSLQIIDLSHNHFNGEIPRKLLHSLDSIKSVAMEKLTYMKENKYLSIEICGWIAQFHYSFTLTNKGTEREYAKIQTFLTAIDLSSNSFEGPIPDSIGDLRGLFSLNLSNNALTGPIPPSLGNMTTLESLDLSHNSLSGEIPPQLAELSFLSSMDVSYNHLTGHIPQGTQFSTFESGSFDGNWGLCGKPLLTECQSSELPPTLPTVDEDEDEEGFGFGWKVVLVGYSTGLAIGLGLGLGFTSWAQLNCIVKNFGRTQ
ncbi:Leucine-rich repeat domain containing protein [Parasponia andersonii]|uniref:Leucine-rich repeat domain containing protein n=1 Tax=Parasponia andersonii TaxID=3476 RepID=A0A2P5C2U0_PARAD|nr:Leucine-rich repeat domain containing protein [Parasponia andersonii]